MKSISVANSSFTVFTTADEDHENLCLLDKLITERENHFHHALSEAADYHLLIHLKRDLDFLKEKREALRTTLKSAS